MSQHTPCTPVGCSARPRVDALGATAAPATHAPLPEAQSPQKFGRKGPPEALQELPKKTHRP